MAQPDLAELSQNSPILHAKLLELHDFRTAIISVRKGGEVGACFCLLGEIGVRIFLVMEVLMILAGVLL